MLPVQGIIDILGGFWEILLLGVRGGFRSRSPYWKWRSETAFGSDPSRKPPILTRVNAILAYGRWVYRMKRGR